MKYKILLGLLVIILVIGCTQEPNREGDLCQIDLDCQNIVCSDADILSEGKFCINNVCSCQCATRLDNGSFNYYECD